MKTKAYFVATIVALSPVAASAASFHGEFWNAPANSFADIDGAISFAQGQSSPDATFSSTSVDYGNSGSNWSIGSLSNFLQADAGSISGSDPTSIQESVFRLSGKSSIKKNDTISVTSDDGFRLFIDGTQFSESTGLRGPNNTTSKMFEDPSGVFNVELWYFEGQQTQARLQSNLTPAPVPLPAAGVLLLGALGGLGGASALRRRRKTA